MFSQCRAPAFRSTHNRYSSISLWTTQKKKPIFTQALAHGMDEAQVDVDDIPIVRKPRWVTSLGCLRYSDLFASGTCTAFRNHFHLILV